MKKIIAILLCSMFLVSCGHIPEPEAPVKEGILPAEEQPDGYVFTAADIPCTELKYNDNKFALTELSFYDYEEEYEHQFIAVARFDISNLSDSDRHYLFELDSVDADFRPSLELDGGDNELDDHLSADLVRIVDDELLVFLLSAGIWSIANNHYRYPFAGADYTFYVTTKQKSKEENLYCFEGTVQESPFDEMPSDQQDMVVELINKRISAWSEVLN